MWRSRWVRLIVLLLVLLGGGGGYWLAQREGPSPVLRTVTVGDLPAMLAVDARTNRAFVTYSIDPTVSVLDASTGAVVGTVALTDEPDTVTVDTPTGRIIMTSDAYHLIWLLDARTGAVLHGQEGLADDVGIDERTGRVLVAGSDFPGGDVNTISLLDGRTGEVLHEGHGLVGGYARGMTVDPRTHRAFVLQGNAAAIGVVDTESGRLLRLVKVGALPLDVAVDSSIGRAYVANNGAGTVSVLDARTGTVLQTITVGMNPARLAVDERTHRVFIVQGRGDVASFTSSATFSSGTTVLDSRTGAVRRRLAVGGTPLENIGSHLGRSVAVDSRRGRVFVLNPVWSDAGGHAMGGSVSVLDASDGRLRETIEVGMAPVDLGVDETSARLFVVNRNAGCVSVDAFGWIPESVRHWLPLLSQPPKSNCPMGGTVTVIDTSHL